jgi:hypothetical protein
MQNTVQYLPAPYRYQQSFNVAKMVNFMNKFKHKEILSTLHNALRYVAGRFFRGSGSSLE